MKIQSKIAHKHLGNVNLFSLKEVIESAKEITKSSDNTDQINIWVSVLTRSDISPSDAIKIAKETGISDVLRVVLNRTNVLTYFKEISSFEAIAQAKSIDVFFVWSIVLARPDVQEYLNTLPFLEALNYIKKGSEDFQKVIFTNLQFSPTEAVAYVIKTGDLDVWKIIFVRPDVQQYLSKLSISEAIDYGTKKNCWAISEIFLNRSDVLAYLNSLDLPEVINYGKIVNYIDFWKIIFAHPKFSTSAAIDYVKKNRDYGILEFVLARPDVQEYLNKLSPSELVDCIKQTGDWWFIWSIVLARPDVQEYLNTLPFLEAVNYAKKGHKDFVQKIVQARIKISLSEVIDYTKRVNDEEVLKIILTHPNCFSLLDSIKYAEEINNEKIWRFVISIRSDVKKYLKDLPSVEAIKYAKKIDIPCVWEMILDHSDIK
ncbi:MAG: hypothetical protein WCX46_03035 [Candidatus Paceibacterota bacterium]